jgi:hypothetical protein
MIASLGNDLFFEWSVYACFRLRQLGQRPVLLYSRSELDRLFLRDRPNDRVVFWSEALANPHFEVVDLDPFKPETAPRMAPDFGAPARLVSAYELGVEEWDHPIGPTGFEAFVARTHASLSRTHAAIMSALARLSPVRAICTSGLIRWTPAFLQAAADRALPTVCIETWAGRPGHMIWNEAGPALHRRLRWQRVPEELTPAEAHEVDRLLDSRRNPSRDAGTGMRSYQSSDVAAGLPKAVQDFISAPAPFLLLGTNVIGDSATLGVATIFRSQAEWITTVAALVRNHPRARLLVRIHPSEATEAKTQRLAPLAASLAEGCDRILVIPPESPINTYRLLDGCAACLTWTSTLGSDAVAMGRPTIVAARAPYVDFEIGRTPLSRGEYLALVTAAAGGDAPPPPPSEIENARRFLWLTSRGACLPAFSGPRPAASPLPALGERPAEDDFYRLLAGIAAPATRSAAAAR